MKCIKHYPSCVNIFEAIFLSPFLQISRKNIAEKTSFIFIPITPMNPINHSSDNELRPLRLQGKFIESEVYGLKKLKIGCITTCEAIVYWIIYSRLIL
ncbi:MAG: hypothetical protein ABI851_09185 [Saprospiraceae bacterium]